MEKWKDIKGYEGLYKISSFGRVESLDRIRRMRVPKYKGDIVPVAFKKGCILKPFFDKRKRARVPLLKNMIVKKYFVSVLVAQHFIEMKKSDGIKNVVNHLDNDPSNNRVENLEWTDQKGNIEYSIKQGRHSSVTRWLNTG